MASKFRSSPVTPLSRRALLIGTATLAVASCRRQRSPVTRSTGPDEFTIRHEGADVRCLFYDRLVAGDRPGCLLIVLLHGAGADATQWFDIGLVDAVDNLQFSPDIHRLVAVAPDIANHERASSLVVDALLPDVDHRFAPGALAISGISRGAIGALAVARDPATAMVSVGLHSPAVRLTAPIDAAPWLCLIDVGDDDALADATASTASMLRASGIDVAERHWHGGHDRPYWRAHLPDYLAFHLDAAQQSHT